MERRSPSRDKRTFGAGSIFRCLGPVAAASLILLSACFGKGDNLPAVEGKVTGTVYDQSAGTPLEGVKVTMDNRGATYSAVTAADGTFSLETGITRRGEGYNVHFPRVNYQNAARAAVFELPNLRVDLGRVDLYDSGPVENRTVRGRVLDNLSDDGLADAQASVQVTYTVPGGSAVTETYVALTDAQGNFELSGKGLMLHSSYAISLAKANYITRTDVTVQITGAANEIDGNPARLILNFGDIAGAVMDDNGDTPLEGALVSVTDGRGSVISGATGAGGAFLLKSEHFYLGRSYPVSIGKADYFPGSGTVYIAQTGENIVAANPIILKINARITGTVRNSGGQAVSGATVSATGSDGVLVSAVTAADGSFTLASAGFRKGQQYSVDFVHARYYGKSVTSPAIVEGGNSLGTVTLNGIPTGGGYRITGVVSDWWEKNVKLAATVKAKDRSGNDLVATADPVTGAFEITGDFTIGDECDLAVSRAGYSGESSVAGETVPVVISGDSPQAVSDVYLYPLGIRAKIGGVARRFSAAVKQTHERFLTEKAGFTLSSRDGGDIETSSTFYVHMDDTADQYANPWGANSACVAVNGPQARGIVVNGRSDARVNTYTFGMPGNSHFHFYAGVPGDYVIETYGAADTVLTLFNGAGGQLASDDDGGGTPGCSKITRFLSAGWHNLRVAGKTASTYGYFQLDVKGPAQAAGATGSWSTNDLILSWYSHGTNLMYIAGSGESGSSGTIAVTRMDRRGGIARGQFSGTMRAISADGATVSVTDGYFNVERSE
ncbi:MAG TPA: carboxypeptidase-like regulatory domain-containing protein [Spirochaetota bacterium]|nr:carboxypeptidase-like regulatory domain-containing protein [Spirochaetota bacterium]